MRPRAQVGTAPQEGAHDLASGRLPTRPRASRVPDGSRHPPQQCSHCSRASERAGAQVGGRGRSGTECSPDGARSAPPGHAACAAPPGRRSLGGAGRGGTGGGGEEEGETKRSRRARKRRNEEGKKKGGWEETAEGEESGGRRKRKMGKEKSES